MVCYIIIITTRIIMRTFFCFSVGPSVCLSDAWGFEQKAQRGKNGYSDVLLYQHSFVFFSQVIPTLNERFSSMPVDKDDYSITLQGRIPIVTD